jgi:hypothetical protein
MKKPEPILIAHLFPRLDELLLSFLRGLAPSDWQRQTVAPQWKIKDVVAHLLDGNIRALSILRDNYVGEKPEGTGSYSELVGFLNRLNADWTRAFRRASPLVLIDLLETTGKEFNHCVQSLDPFAPAVLSVDWAGESKPTNWFHIAREYTEKWHHQQQIRFAADNDTVLLSEQYYLPYLDTSMRALPYHYRHIRANAGDTITFRVSGVAGAEWHLVHTAEGWELFSQCERTSICTVEIGKDSAWRILTKAIDQKDAKALVHVEGDKQLGEWILAMTAVMA